MGKKETKKNPTLSTPSFDLPFFFFFVLLGSKKLSESTSTSIILLEQNDSAHSLSCFSLYICGFEKLCFPVLE